MGENRGVQSTNAGFAVVREGHRPVINCRPVYLMPYNNLIYADFSDNAKVDIIGCRGDRDCTTTYIIMPVPNRRGY